MEVERPAAFASRSLPQTERRYSQIEEMPAVYCQKNFLPLYAWKESDCYMRSLTFRFNLPETVVKDTQTSAKSFFRAQQFNFISYIQLISNISQGWEFFKQMHCHEHKQEL